MDNKQGLDTVRLVSPESVSAKMSPQNLAYFRESSAIKQSTIQDVGSLKELSDYKQSASMKESASYKHSPLQYRSIKIEPE